MLFLYKIVLMSLLLAPLAQAAAHPEPKMIPGNACLENGYCTKLTDNMGAVLQLMYCLTGEKPSWDDIEKRMSEMPALIAEKSGLPVKEDEMLITVAICDPVERPRTAWHNGGSTQFVEAPRWWNPSRMWPYSWFAHAKEGEQVKIPMLNGTYVAVLSLIASRQNPGLTFARSAGSIVGRRLAEMYMDEETKQEVQKLERERQSHYRSQEWFQKSGVLANFKNPEDADDIVQFHEKQIQALSKRIRSLEGARGKELLKKRYDVDIDFE